MTILNGVVLIPRLFISPSDSIFVPAFTSRPDLYNIPDVCIPDSSTIIPPSTDIVVVAGPMNDVLRPKFLNDCQAVMGNSKFHGNKYLFTDEINMNKVAADPIIIAQYLRLFDRIITLFPNTSSDPDITQVQYPVLSDVSANREDRPSVIALYIPTSIATRNPYFQRNICQTLVRNIVQTLRPNSLDSDVTMKLLSFSEPDYSVCIDVAQCFLKHGIDVSIERLAQLEYVRQYCDGLISWDPALTFAAIGIPCSVFSTADDLTILLEKVSAESLSDNVIYYTNDVRYGKPKELDVVSLENALNCLRSGRKSLELRQTTNELIDLHTLINNTQQTRIVVGPVKDSSHSDFITPALHSADIDARAKLVFGAMKLFIASLESKDPLIIARFVLYQITKRAELSKYVYGLASLLGRLDDFDSEMSNRKLAEALHWLIKDAFTEGQTWDYPIIHKTPKWLVQHPSSLFVATSEFNVNLDSIFRQSSFEGVHRAGWAFVKSGLSVYHLNTSPVFVDLYADATFGWMENIFSFDTTLPYTAPWVAFFHHGWDTRDAFSVKSAISKPSFGASLPTCRAICVLSDDLALKLSVGLKALYVTHPPIVTFRHPTEFVDTAKEFSIGKFLANPVKRVVQIGSFYRKSFSIYALPLGTSDGLPNILGLRKTHLRSAHSARYFKPECLEKELVRIGNRELERLVTTPGLSQPIISEICHAVSCSDDSVCDNVYIKGLIDHLDDLNRNVETLETLDDDAYDDLLSQNIVFVDLEDASAVNTVLECIVRNTPILVNPLPAVIEVLGPNYPLYYGSLRQAALHLTDEVLIRQSAEYLAGLDKSKFKLDYFLLDFREKLQPLLFEDESNT